MPSTDQRARLLSAIFLIAFACVPATAEMALPGEKAPDPNEREVSLMRQDFSDCQNGNVSDREPWLIGGTAWVVRGSDGKTNVKVAMTAKANTTYHFFLKCIRILGDIKTDDEGTAIQTFTFSTNEVGNVFAFDMYPDGAPAGDKYQSVQIKY